jgi:CRISPR/Cas system CSM-associated protein Csm3 (group 7 of RAMP superfamily)
MNTTSDPKASQCLWRYLARVTVQLKTPMHIGAGREWNASDAGVVLDANGLPSIPGSSIAGVLRHAFEAKYGEEQTNRLFGYQGQRPKNSDQSAGGLGSRLTISWGCIHNSKNSPVCGLLKDTDRNDCVLSTARQLTLRDHVRLNGCGVAADKFDELVVCVGNRFTFEIELEGNGEDETVWKQLLDLFVHPLTRLGGKTRRGFGSLEIISCKVKEFHLNEDSHFKEYCELHPSLASVPHWPDLKSQLFSGQFPVEEIALDLKPSFFWMFGGGRDSDADLAPVQDRIVVWDDQDPAKTEVSTRFYIPGSAVKGALRHRIFFHACAITGHYAGKADGPGHGKAEKIVEELFGSERTEDRRTAGVPGRLFVDDVILPSSVKIIEKKVDFLDQPHLQHHVHIDRFTGGARQGMLFSEKPLFQGAAISTRLYIDRSKAPLSSDASKALRMALDGLIAGRLALGGGNGRGLGVFKGSHVFQEKSQLEVPCS